MSLPTPRLYNAYTDTHLLPELAQIQADCIIHDNQLASFLPPLSHTRMTEYWREISSSEVETQRTAVILQFTGEDEAEVAGYVCLEMPVRETGPFRGEVVRLMVSPKYRRQGVARRVMEKLEEFARETGRFLLKLDTTIGLPAEQVYPKLGYKEVGVIPRYGISPKDGSLVDEKFFYKDLRDEK